MAVPRLRVPSVPQSRVAGAGVSDEVPYCDAVYEVADVDRYPVGEAVNFAKPPIDFGVIHYASDTPYTQARTLGARGLSYHGMDSTYASSLAILRRIFTLEGAPAPSRGG
jgi:hypothetical protein